AGGQIAAGQSYGLLVIDAATLAVITEVAAPGTVAVVVTPDGNFVYAATQIVEPWTISVSVVATATNTVVATIPLDSKNSLLGIDDIAISPDGSTVLVSEYS